MGAGVSFPNTEQPTMNPSNRFIRTFSKNKVFEEEQKEEKHPELKKHVFGLFDAVTRFLADGNNKTDKKFGQLNKLLLDNVVKPFDDFTEAEQREVMGNKLARIQFVELAVDYYVYVLEDEGVEAVTTGCVIESHKTQDPGLALLLTLRKVFWNFSDGSYSYEENLSETPLFPCLLTDLKAIFDDDIEQLEHDEDIFAFNSAVGILHNCARNHEIDCKVFRSIGAIETLSPFLRSNDIYVKMVTLLALGNMINFDDKKQVRLLDTGKDVVTFVFQAIKHALENTDRRAHGFTVSELVDGLTSLAKSDDNKQEIMALRPLDTIKEILRRKKTRQENNVQYNCEVLSEKIAAIRLVWELAFLKTNKDKILADQELMQFLQELKRDSDLELRTAANGAYIVVAEEQTRIVAEPEAIGSRSSRKEPHIMISYSWSDQTTVLKINDYLERENYPTWMDVKFMKDYSSVLEGMASAVEGASMVLICYSEKYKNSQNCRTEAELVFMRKKPFICLRMQQGYKADGWLGALLGAKLFIDFSDKYPFDKKIAELIDRLEPTQKPIPGPIPGPIPEQPEEPGTVDDWKKYDVQYWASKHQMENPIKTYARVRQLTGQQLTFFYKVYKQAPDTFYRWVETKLRLDALEDIMRFTKAIEALAHYIS